MLGAILPFGGNVSIIRLLIKLPVIVEKSQELFCHHCFLYNECILETGRFS